MNGTAALDRDALYYPYIHITDVNWLKGTLLCFPSVRRMVPESYVPHDSPEIKEFMNVSGPRGPLLSQVNLRSRSADKAESYLLNKLQENDSFIRSHYSRHNTIQQFGPHADDFKMHVEKIDYRLADYLTGSFQKEPLAWLTDRPEDRPERAEGSWIALHPKLGSAILATKALAIAKDLGLDIVTDSDLVHHIVVSKRQDDIFDELIEKPIPTHAPDQHDTLDDLAEIVMTTSFDVSKLSVEQIAELLSDGKDLRKFKNALIPHVAELPAMTNAREREDRLRAAAADVVTEWNRYKKSLGRLAVDAISDATTEIKWPESVLGSSVILSLGAGKGIALFLVTHAGLKVWRRFQQQAASPYSYLSRIEKAQNKSQQQLTLPPFAYLGL